MNSLFSFLRDREAARETQPEAQPAAPTLAASAIEREISPPRTARPVIRSDSVAEAALRQMLACFILASALPVDKLTTTSGLPIDRDILLQQQQTANSAGTYVGLERWDLALLSKRDLPAGLGALVGVERLGLLVNTEVKGLRLEAVVRLTLQADTVSAQDQVRAALQSHLLVAQSDLRRQGMLTFALGAMPPAEQVSGNSSWRGMTEYQLLFEYQYLDGDSAHSLITRIPIQSDLAGSGLPHPEVTLVTNAIMRWDHEGALPLVVSGRFTLTSLSTLAFVANPPPAGAVTLIRTYVGATGDPSEYASLEAFLAAISGAQPDRNAQLRFDSLSAFLGMFSAAGDTVPLGHWNVDGIVDRYAPGLLPLPTSIQLINAEDRFVVTYTGAVFDPGTVLYLRALGG